MKMRHFLLSSLLFVGCELSNDSPTSTPPVTPWYNWQAITLDGHSCNKFNNDQALYTLASKQFINTLNADALAGKKNTFTCPILSNTMFGLLLFGSSKETEDAILDYLDYEDKNSAIGMLSYGSNISQPSSIINLSKSYKGIKRYKYSAAFISFVKNCEDFEIEAVDTLSSSDNRIELHLSFSATLAFSDLGVSTIAKEGYFINSSNQKDTIDILNIEGKFPSFEDERIKIVSLPIGADSIEFVFFLPKSHDNIYLSRDSIFQLASRTLESDSISFNLPLTNVNSTASIYDYLPRTIQQTAFSVDNADFSNINDSGYVWLSSAFTTSSLNISSTGITSAVRDTIIFKSKPNEPATLWENDYAVHVIRLELTPTEHENIGLTCYPFSYVIRNTNSKTIMFVAHVNYP